MVLYRLRGQKLAVTIAVGSFALILVSIGGGLFLRYKLPNSHLSGNSKDVIRLATALIGTMAAVVVALLFASTRSTYEAKQPGRPPDGRRRRARSAPEGIWRPGKRCAAPGIAQRRRLDGLGDLA